jgi:hypothetical protein
MREDVRQVVVDPNQNEGFDVEWADVRGSGKKLVE